MSTLPTRRTLRTTRTTSTRENENTHARQQRNATHVKPHSAAGTAGLKAKSVSDANVDIPGKRKREVLVEVPANIANSRNPTATASKGKEKEVSKKFEGVVVVNKPRATVRPVHSAPSSRRAGAVKKEPVVVVVEEELTVVEEEPEVDNAPTDDNMVVDPRSEVAIPELVSQQYCPAYHDEDLDDHRAKRARTSSEAPQPIDDDPLQDDEGEDDLFDLHLHSIEADPLGDEWDDLDADDDEDPLMVNEYVVEIFQYLKDIEPLTMPNPNYMQTHKELSWRIRGVLLDWLIGVHGRCRLTPETFHLCTNILDRFMSLRVCSLVRFQLFGITCLWIAAKVEEIGPPCASDLILLTDGAYTEEQMFKAERYILKNLDFNLNHPNPMHFLRRISKADDYNVRVRTLGKYFAEIGCMEWRLIATPPSLLAAAAMWLARLVLGMEQWTPNLAHYSTYSQSEILPTANLMLNYILKPPRHEQFHKKYAKKQNMKASEIVRAWALQRWEESSQVMLQQELPSIKAEIRAARREEENQALRASRR